MGREKVREYALATGWADPALAADGSEIGSEASDQVPVPATFAAVFTLPQAAALLGADPELGARPALHGTQEFELHRPLRVGDVLRCTPAIVDIRPRGRLTFLTLEVACVDVASGEPVVTSRGTFMVPDEQQPADAGA